MLIKPKHPRDYMGKFNIRWAPNAFISILRQDLNQTVEPAEWTLDYLLKSRNPRCSRWSAIWWLLTEGEPVPDWVWRDAAWILFKGDKTLVNPVPTYAFLDFIESRLELARFERLQTSPRVPFISQTTLGHEISLISACIIGANQGETEIRWGMGKYGLEELSVNVLFPK
ncbi:MAG: hypothetical protein WA131_10935 [Desulfitobacteriaceae bacterium]